LSAIDPIAKLAIVLSGGIFATTIHAQDFKDIEGDRKIGRRTIPIVLPVFSRVTVIIPMVLWSFGLGRVWDLGAEVAAPFVALALVVGGRFLLFRSVAEDQVSFYLYNVSSLTFLPLGLELMHSNVGMAFGCACVTSLLAVHGMSLPGDAPQT
jgi:4-hydroxybenzoate polyprenyltransferase